MLQRRGPSKKSPRPVDAASCGNLEARRAVHTAKRRENRPASDQCPLCRRGGHAPPECWWLFRNMNMRVSARMTGAPDCATALPAWASSESSAEGSRRTPPAPVISQRILLAAFPAPPPSVVLAEGADDSVFVTAATMRLMLEHLGG